MTISIHAQTAFEDYNFFKNKMDEILSKYPQIKTCLYGRSKTENFAKKYFIDTDIECKNPKLSRLKIQNLYKQIEQLDLSIFFYRDDIKVGSELTGKSIQRAINLDKEYIVFKYDLIN